MKTPTEFEVQELMHRADYDPVKAREYYLRTRKLKGRKKSSQDEPTGILGRALARIPKDLPKGPKGPDPRKGKTKQQIHKDARARQRKELSDQIQGMERRLNKLEALFKEREHEEASEDRKGKAKKERAAKEADKPKTAAEKAEAARESKKDRAKNQQKLKSDRKKDSDKKDTDEKKK
ncbi:MAG TPA: hypothetical protein VEO92_06370, partial [Candidatus Nitrosocosmicus sp.]|nr:hypothetical protein [Candidatus Nitrosocosmicus sp.]